MLESLSEALTQITRTAGEHLGNLGFWAGILVFLFGPYDMGMHAVTLMFIISIMAITLDYLKAWIDPEIDDRIEIDRIANIFMWRWISYGLLLMTGNMMLQLTEAILVFRFFQGFICVTEFFIILPFIENISGIKLIAIKAFIQSHPMLKNFVVEERK